jgi:hypothetical protein
MRRTLSRAAALAGLVLGSAAVAQPPPNAMPLPRITSAFPPGAQAGTSVEVTVSGTDLDDAAELLFSHPKITAEVVAPPEKPDPKAKEKKKSGGRRRGGGTPATVKFRVTVPADVPVGQYDLRVVGRFGVSNPRAFVVGDRPEVEELEPNDDALPPDPTAAAVAGGPMLLPTKNAPRAQRVELGSTVNGVIGSPTDVDYVVFAGKAGQRVLISCLTTSIDSRARPLVELYDPAGRRVGQNRNYRDGDALLDATLPADGDYFVRVCEFAYQQGGPDYFYRLTVGTGPWIDAVFPPAVKPGLPRKVTLYGRNLPGGKPVPGMHVDGRPLEALTVTVTPPAEPAARTQLALHGRVPPPMGLQDAFEYRLTGSGGASNAVPIFLTNLKVVAEQEGNDDPDSAQPIPVPCEVAGRIDKRADRDFYSFTAKKGAVLWIEAVAERNGSASDLFLRVKNEKGQDISPDLDDDPDPLHPINFFSRSGDPPAYKFTAPADGKYLILVGSTDANVNYGPRCFYRLRVAPPRPDFRAVVMAPSRDLPAAVTARPDGEVAYEVYVHRTDGFADPVTVTAEGLPPGVTCKPALIGSRMRWGTLVLSAAAGAKEFGGPITVTCSATIDGKKVVREARPATITWGVPPGQNVPTVTRLDQQLVLAVRPDRSPFRIAADLSAAKLKTRGQDGKEKEEKVDGPVYVKPGDKLTVPVKLTWHEKDARPAPLSVQMEPTQPNPQQAPVTVNNSQPVQIAPGKNEGPVTIDVRPNAPPGTYPVALRGETQVPFARNPEQKQKVNVTVAAFAQPIEVTVLPVSLAKLTVQPPGPLKPGTTGELVVKVERQFDYAGEFVVTVTPPKGAEGVDFEEVTIPAGKDEVKVPVEVDEDAKPGAVNNVVVRAVATVHGKFPVVHETKVNLTIAKK